MSAGSVSCMIIWPLRAFKGTPLTSILTVSSAITLSRDGRAAVQVRGAFRDGSSLVLDHVLEFGFEMLQEALHRPGGCIAQGANGVSFDAIGHVEQKAQILAAPLAGDDPLEHAVQPARAFPAGRALTTGLRHVEARQPLQR